MDARDSLPEGRREEIGDVAESDEPFRVGAEQVSGELAQELDAPVTAAGTEYGTDLRVPESVLQFGEPLGRTARIRTLVLTVRTGVEDRFEIPAAEEFDGILEFDGIKTVARRDQGHLVSFLQERRNDIARILFHIAKIGKFP